jgi:hypothetical protein
VKAQKGSTHFPVLILFTLVVSFLAGPNSGANSCLKMFTGKTSAPIEVRTWVENPNVKYDGTPIADESLLDMNQYRNAQKILLLADGVDQFSTTCLLGSEISKTFPEKHVVSTDIEFEKKAYDPNARSQRLYLDNSQDFPLSGATFDKIVMANGMNFRTWYERAYGRYLVSGSGGIRPFRSELNSFFFRLTRHLNFRNPDASIYFNVSFQIGIYRKVDLQDPQNQWAVEENKLRAEYEANMYRAIEDLTHQYPVRVIIYKYPSHHEEFADGWAAVEIRPL